MEAIIMITKSIPTVFISPSLSPSLVDGSINLFLLPVAAFCGFPSLSCFFTWSQFSLFSGNSDSQLIHSLLHCNEEVVSAHEDWIFLNSTVPQEEILIESLKYFTACLDFRNFLAMKLLLDPPVTFAQIIKKWRSWLLFSLLLKENVQVFD
ncbi:hypothetical protein L6164_032695 [Bauhinia variegata]|uniref:Uncharacterized protein n=1 Tax=Bauhinia variegata TaxID=167791 RepID=A0ACB9KPG8_BAUVA|nr:hypothetical protein L6164_032695 [Bauhinia variegata]